MSRSGVGVLLLIGVLMLGAKLNPKLVAAAEAGDVQAQFDLATAYATGRHAPRSQRQAAIWFLKAAEQGDARAQVSLGSMYDSGKGVKKSDAEAVKWIFRAARSGHPRGQFLMAQRFAQGRGVEKNLILAHMWMTLARAAGSGAAQFQLGPLDVRLTPAQRKASRQLASSWARTRGTVSSARK